VPFVLKGRDGRLSRATARRNRWLDIVPTTMASSSMAVKLLDQVRETIRARHYSRWTEEAYVTWIRRFIVFHRKRHPSELGAAEVAAFVSSLASARE
jgi:Phage integrase, N-terminal SAM-like domain